MIERYPNQKLFVEVIIADGKVTQVTPVAKIKNPDITLTLTFETMDKGMLLSVNNSLPNSLHWPHPIPKLQIKNFHLLGNEKELACTY
jgi:hypothetical protein